MYVQIVVEHIRGALPMDFSSLKPLVKMIAQYLGAYINPMRNKFLMAPSTKMMLGFDRD